MSRGASAFADSFLRTLSGLTAMERDRLAMDALRQEQEEKKALDAAWANRAGRIGQADDYTAEIAAGSGIGNARTGQNSSARLLSEQGALPGDTAADRDFERASADAAAGAMYENAQRQGRVAADTPRAAIDPTVYTQKQGMQDYIRDASKISRKGTMEALQMKSVMRESEKEDAFDTAMDGLDKQISEFKAGANRGGMKEAFGLLKKIDPDIRYVEKDGSPVIEVLNSKGKVTNTLTDVNAVLQVGTAGLVQNFFSNEAPKFSKNVREAFDFWKTRQAERRADRTLELTENADARAEKKLPYDIEESSAKTAEARAKGKYYESAGRYYDAGRGRETLSGKVNEYAELIVNSGQINPQTNKPFTTEEAKRYAAGVVLKDPNTKEVNNKDVLDFVDKNGDMASDVMDPKTGKPIPVRNLPLGEQRRIAVEFYTGRATGGMPDLPKGGLKRPEAKPTSALPGAQGMSDSEFNTMLADARRGGSTGTAYIREKLAANELNLRQRMEAEKILQTR